MLPIYFRMVQKLENETTESDKGKNPSSPKSRLAVLKRSKKPAGSDPFRFQGQGVFYKVLTAYILKRLFKG